MADVGEETEAPQTPTTRPVAAVDIGTPTTPTAAQQREIREQIDAQLEEARAVYSSVFRSEQDARIVASRSDCHSEMYVISPNLRFAV